MSGEPVSEHIDVGAYALGLLEPEDRRAFEEHLAGCPECAADLAGFSGLKDLLTGLGPVPSGTEEPPEAEVVELFRHHAVDQRRRGRRRFALGAAAAVVTLVVGLGVGLVTASEPAPPAPGKGVSFSATDPVTQVRGVVDLAAKTWGTMITLDLFHLAGPKDCQIVAVSATGQSQVLGSWQVPPHSHFGLPGHPSPLVIVGPTGFKINNLSQIKINVLDRGKATKLVSIRTQA